MLLSGVVCGHPCELGRGPVVGMERDVVSPWNWSCQKDLTCIRLWSTVIVFLQFGSTVYFHSSAC